LLGSDPPVNETEDDGPDDAEGCGHHEDHKESGGFKTDNCRRIRLHHRNRGRQRIIDEKVCNHEKEYRRVPARLTKSMVYILVSLQKRLFRFWWIFAVFIDNEYRQRKYQEQYSRQPERVVRRCVTDDQDDCEDAK